MPGTKLQTFELMRYSPSLPFQPRLLHAFPSLSRMCSCSHSYCLSDGDDDDEDDPYWAYTSYCDDTMAVVVAAAVVVVAEAAVLIGLQIGKKYIKVHKS